jgi:hypothetical protein
VRAERAVRHCGKFPNASALAPPRLPWRLPQKDVRARKARPLAAWQAVAVSGTAVAAGLDQVSDVMSTVQFNRELRLLDLPDARWSRYRGAGGMADPHPITVPEQAALLRWKPNKITSFSQWPAGRKRTPGMSSSKVYRRGDLEVAIRKHEAAGKRAGPRLRLITPTSD